MICLVISLSYRAGTTLSLVGSRSGGNTAYWAGSQGESQCLGVRQAAGTAAKAKQLYITFQLFRHQELHHIEELCAV